MSTDNTRTLTIAWAVGLSAIAVILSQAVGSALTAVSVWLVEPHEAGTVAVNPMALSLAVAFGFGLVTWVILNRYLSDRSWLDALALRGLTGREIAYAILGGTMLQFPLAELSNLVEEFVPIALEHKLAIHRLLNPTGLGEAVGAALMIVVAPAVFEEVFFRGALFGGLRRRYSGPLTVLVTGVLFGFVHMMPHALVYASVAGLILGWIRYRTGSLYATILVHGAVNATPLLLPVSVVPIAGFNIVREEVYHLNPWLFLATLFGATFFLWRLGANKAGS